MQRLEELAVRARNLLLANGHFSEFNAANAVVGSLNKTELLAALSEAWDNNPALHEASGETLQELVRDMLAQVVVEIISDDEAVKDEMIRRQARTDLRDRVLA